ncbi:hypothetical protein ACFW1M_09755 [Streptomyces inhibens]|uniref:hypothetical protein n=1 Tax=Streptomyces inhibens TaxID=2293571 RepID=UPI0036C63AEA
MFPKSKSGKFGLCVVSGALAGAVVAGPAAAADDDEGEGEVRARYEGRVVARSGLVVRTGPSTHYSTVGSKEYGAVVGITCRLNGQRVRGNPVWYKLSDASYAWSSVRDIVNDGEDPQWC